MKTILAMILISVVLLSGCSLLDAGSIVPICVEGGYGCPTTGTSGTFSYNSARNRIIFEGQQISILGLEKKFFPFTFLI